MADAYWLIVSNRYTELVLNIIKVYMNTDIFLFNLRQWILPMCNKNMKNNYHGYVKCKFEKHAKVLFELILVCYFNCP